MRRLDYAVPPGDEGRRLDTILTLRLRLSRHRIASLKFAGGLLLDGRPAHTDARVHAGQVVTAVLRDAPASLTPYPLPLRVAYADEDLLIVDKPAPLPSIHGARQDGRTLENAVYAYLGCPAFFQYRPVSRLDKGTSGLMPIALNACAHDRLQRALHTAAYTREYLAVTEGAPRDDAGTLAWPIGRGNGVRRRVDPGGRPAVTHYRVLLRAANGRALVRLRLETGRTHQIRVHLQALGCPVAGDYLYGAPLPELPGRFALHAAHIALTHPLSGEALSLDSPPPPEMTALLGE